MATAKGNGKAPKVDDKVDAKVSPQGGFPCPWEDGYVGDSPQALRGHMVGSGHLKSNGSVLPTSPSAVAPDNELIQRSMVAMANRLTEQSKQASYDAGIDDKSVE